MPVRILNNIDHRDLKVDPKPRERYGDFVNRAVVMITEYPELHKELPILVHKDSDKYEAHAILGLESNENLFIEDNQWTTRHLPAALARGPFSFGHQRREKDGQEEQDTVILVDEEDPRCNATEGEPVFLKLGGESRYLEYIKKTLQMAELGMKADTLFFDLLRELELLEPAAIQVTLNDSLQINFSNYYTINQERLAQLNGDQLLRINRAGFLGSIFYMLSSMSNFNRMIALKNARSSVD